jgi:site-specific recombinase XerD
MPPPCLGIALSDKSCHLQLPRWEVASMRRRKAKKQNRQKIRLGLPDLDHVKSAVLVSLRSPESQSSYRRSIEDFVCWYCSEPRLSFNKTVVTRYRIHLEDRLLAPGTINVRLAAVRRLAYEAADTGLLSPDLAAGIRRVKGAKKLGMRLGNWLTVEQARSFWQLPSMHTVKGKRDRAILAVLLGCGLRRRELIDLTFDHIQRREDHWAIVDLVGKGGHIRTVPMPDWVKQTIDDWLAAAGNAHGKIFRCVCRKGVVWGTAITEKVVWHVVKEYAERLGIPKLAPHDLRRSCARLCHESGGELEQIQFLLGHVSVQTTEKYLGCKQRLREAVNDRLGIEPTPDLV